MPDKSFTYITKYRPYFLSLILRFTKYIIYFNKLISGGISLDKSWL